MWSVVLGVLALLLVSAAAFARPPADPAPQPGAVIGGRAVVVYTPAYRVSFFGVERLHPFDGLFLRGLAAGLAGFAALAAIGWAVEPLGAPIRAAILLVTFLPLCWVTLRLGLDREDREALGKPARTVKLV